jgi:hypothetical protein
MHNLPRREDPLRAMYFVAAILMGLAFLVVVAMIFVPPNFFERLGRDEWTPGTEEYVAPGDVPRPPETPAERAAREELHVHE